MLKRPCYQYLWETLSKDRKIILISGPRQSGKTTFSQSLGERFPNNIYFNWDAPSSKKMFLRDPAFFEKMDRKDDSAPLVILDEIHKYKRWKNYLKGIYDEFKGRYHFLVTGSGRLDLWEKGGEALTGRYMPMNLFPLTLSELSKNKRNLADFKKNPLRDFDGNPVSQTKDIWNQLLKFGGFPEPFVKSKEDFLTRWSESYARQIIRDDIRSVFDLKDIANMELLYALLPSKSGSPISLNNIAQDLGVAFDTVKNWLRIFDLFYLVFSVSTWTPKISRSILKEKKLYFFNVPEVEEEGPRFENLIALELHKSIALWNQAGLGQFKLHYLRNKDGEEADFLIANKNVPILLVETKWNDENVSKSLIRFQNQLQVPAAQLVKKEGIFRRIKNGDLEILVVTAHRWLSSLPDLSS